MYPKTIHFHFHHPKERHLMASFPITAHIYAHPVGGVKMPAANHTALVSEIIRGKDQFLVRLWLESNKTSLPVQFQHNGNEFEDLPFECNNTVNVQIHDDLDTVTLAAI